MQSTDHQEVMVLPLRGVARAEDGGLTCTAAAALDGFVGDLGLARTRDGFDGPSGSVLGSLGALWASYRDIRAPPRRYSAPPLRTTAEQRDEPCCRVGAPLVVAALQRVGAVPAQVDAARVTPTSLAQLVLEEPAYFARPVPVRGI